MEREGEAVGLEGRNPCHMELERHIHCGSALNLLTLGLNFDKLAYTNGFKFNSYGVLCLG
jgi:hypothetical protein